MGRWFDDDLSGSDLLHLLGLRERMKRSFDEQAERAADQSSSQLGWSPAVDIHDAGEAFLLAAELPGLSESEIDLEIVGDSLILSGERVPNTNEKVICYHRVERPEGPFKRTFRLPAEVDSARVRAEYKDGILIVELPKLSTPSTVIVVEVK